MSTERDPKTAAQWYCLLAGLALLGAGAFGFIADASFNAGTSIDGEEFLGFEVNGWHNLVHLLSGAVLLAAAGRRTSAKTVAILFGLTYGAVAAWGLIDGNTVLGLLPVNTADHVLHVALSAIGLLAGLASPGDQPLRTTTAPGGYATTGRRIESDPFLRDTVVSGGNAPLDPSTGRARGEEPIGREPGS